MCYKREEQARADIIIANFLLSPANNNRDTDEERFL